ncbi:hypothetical protein Nepgr_008988 [Nepenthes gracilis]|uniref:Uncharacterized protein n=1 Tax=Nepenthes gracilis TaxID=150966 RepID=A0AAD3S9Y9_NEPGR|nr:hypothetical protein Nepgr_008988 [Nepenthes gracilis]
MSTSSLPSGSREFHSSHVRCQRQVAGDLMIFKFFVAISSIFGCLCSVADVCWFCSPSWMGITPGCNLN